VAERQVHTTSHQWFAEKSRQTKDSPRLDMREHKREIKIDDENGWLTHSKEWIRDEKRGASSIE
jgi:hypothetical protein